MSNFWFQAVSQGVAGIIKTCRSFQSEYVSAYEPRDPKDREKYWLVATEEGCDNVRVCRYDKEQDARGVFDEIWCCRILYNTHGDEVQCAGWNPMAHATIRRVMTEKYLTG
ncbi:hypothetical protein PHYPSEUDO_001109 [Phytophthora pseudosyringae]|uniref:Uncharacterized protein n=1 Tax=Phytophthora pseudosyringae TaxID=221518 RepID=A0A8T1VXT5_9STRA|nr:hypothetical protein PHYPSEUDO_001109 [Phytophthora pseudosyringae]